ncbi:hypothetical protein R3P38DRAFT_3224983 [Favolaschia claudopus]|uniref:Uncharacterized protein n=1 Tax=Favolaschia claudopus TaxID=2862362 RepID=A0AAV9ZUV6_9AGAR
MAVDPYDSNSLTWYGLWGDCQHDIVSRAADLLDDTAHLEKEATYDDLGRFTRLDPGFKPDWYRDSKPFAGWIPISAAEGKELEWFLDFESPVLLTTREGQWEFDEEALEIMACDLARIRQVVEALKNHSKYDEATACPEEFNVDLLYRAFDTPREAQVIAAQAKRAVGEYCGQINWWMSSISDWDKGIPIDLVLCAQKLRLAGRKKRGFLVSLHRDWQALNFGLLIENKMPLYYIWGLFDSTDPRFGRLNPRLIDAYNFSCERIEAQTVSLESMHQMKEEYRACLDFDKFLDKVRDPHHRKILPVPLQTTVSGNLEYWVKDAVGWRRRKLAPDEDFLLMDRLFHHVVVEDRETSTTLVIFHRFHKKPRNLTLAPHDQFMDEDIPEPDDSEIRERFKGKCAPKMGQTFDPMTGVERSKPIDIKDSVAVQTIERGQFLLPPSGEVQGRSLLSRVTGEMNPYPDLMRIGRTMGPRQWGTSSEHSSERREGDSRRPMAFEGGWAAAMARSDHAGNYRSHRPSRRQQHPGSETSNSEYEETRTHISISSRDRSPLNARRRSASPPPRRRAPDERHQNPTVGNRQLMQVQGRLAHRADFLDNLREWCDPLTHNAVLWKIPSQYIWNMDFLRDTYLIVSEAAEMRLRMIALRTPNVRYLRHVLELGIERGIPFHLALRSSVCESYRPRAPILHRATTKAQLEDSSRRLEAAGNPAQTYNRWLKLLGDIASLENARAIIARGGVVSWIARNYGFLGLVGKLMEGPSVHVTIFNGGGNDSADEDSMRLKWDELSENDYQCLYGYVPGSTREKDSWIYPPDELLEELSKHYYREWNPVVDDLMRRVRKEWDDKGGKLRTRKGWQEFFHGTNHGKWAPKVEVNERWIEEAKERFGRAFRGSWNKKPVWEILLPETFREEF